MKKHLSKHKHNKKQLDPLYLYINETDKKRKKQYENFLEHTSDLFSVPKDIFAGQPEINMTGNHRIRVCNYNSVAEYTTEYISLLVGKKNILIYGNSLLIDFLRKEEIIILGNISKISFEGMK